VGFILLKLLKIQKKAFSNIVLHAANSTLSEQPSFYAVLCGEKGEYRISNNTCFNGYVSTKFLSRSLFPNGAIIWNNTFNIHDSFISHVNWISGFYNKLTKMLYNNWWVLNNNGKCIYR